MTPSPTAPLQPYKQPVSTIRPNWSEIKIGIKYLATQNTLTLN
ncbi:unnamed protein product [marine sediment metagenome]|uniref:Uncharacterized protein n=1 Tax=marine sediment metagenome TaxID=412755 RepID=X1QYE8_9ZZZZ